MSFRPSSPCVGPVTRRGFLEAGSLFFGGLVLSDLLRMRADGDRSPARRRRDEETSVILLWLPGGPPHMEMYDMKPDAPAEYRGEFRPIPTVVPGPGRLRAAAPARADRRQVQDRPLGRARVRRPRRRSQAVPHRPDPGRRRSSSSTTRRWSARSWPRSASGATSGVPNYVAGTDPGRNGVDVFSFGAAYLGPGDDAVHVRAATRAPPTSRSSTWRSPPSWPAGSTTGSGSATASTGSAATSTGSGAVDALDEFDRKALGAPDQPQGPRRLRPLARRPAAPRPLRPARLGPAGPARPPARRGRLQLRDDGAGEPRPRRAARTRRA